MHNKINKNEDGFITGILRKLQFILLSFSSALLLFWVLEIFNIPMGDTLNDFFHAIANIGGSLYGETLKIGNYNVNFSFLSTLILFSLVSYCITLLIEFIEGLGVKAENLKQKVKNVVAREFNKNLEKEVEKEILKSNKFLVLIDFRIESNKSSWDDNFKEMTIKNVTSSFFALLEGNIECESEFIDDKLLLIFNDFAIVDKSLTVLESLFGTLKKEYKERKCVIDWSAAIDTYEYITDVGEKTQTLKKLLKLFIPDRFMCLATFVARYNLQQDKKYDLMSNGFYTVNGQEEVFTLRKKMN